MKGLVLLWSVLDHL